MDYSRIVSVIGGAGHIGLPFSLYCADRLNAQVNIWDNNSDLVNHIKTGEYPYHENAKLHIHPKEILNLNLGTDKLLFNDHEALMKSDVIIVTLGTPLDEENNPRTESVIQVLRGIFNALYVRNYEKIPLIILRSTVYPGFTELLKSRLDMSDRIVPYNLVYAPERVAQNTGFDEIGKFPQIIGFGDEESRREAELFFTDLGMPYLIFLKFKEAEYTKILTNMYRYVNFAFANEMYRIGSEEDVDIHAAIMAANIEYPRMNMPLPGANVGGPCMYKDGRFLINNDNISGSLSNMSFFVNESMPAWIVNQIKYKLKGVDVKLDPKYNFKTGETMFVAILGATFKAESDDTRNSLSFKMDKLCRANNWFPIMIDPYTNIDYENSVEHLKHANVVILMTPHKEFKTIFPMINDEALVVDIWKHFDVSKKTKTGIYFTKEVKNG